MTITITVEVIEDGPLFQARATCPVGRNAETLAETGIVVLSDVGAGRAHGVAFINEAFERFLAIDAQEFPGADP